jgi:hypothetical protein
VRRPKLAATGRRPHDRANGLRIFRRPLQADAQSRLRTEVSINFSRATILPDREIEPSVLIEVAQRRATRFSKNCKATFPRRHGDESAVPITAKPQTAACILPAFRRGYTKKVLRQEPDRA